MEQQTPPNDYPVTPVDTFLRRPWTAFVSCGPDSRDTETEILINSRYQVYRRRLKASDKGPDMIMLSFKRLDKGIFIPYRDKMRIKDELVGRECEAVELYPARSREQDVANQFYLWVVEDTNFRFPFGFTTRTVSDVSFGGSVQEPWPDEERPPDSIGSVKELMFHISLQFSNETLYIEQEQPPTGERESRK